MGKVCAEKGGLLFAVTSLGARVDWKEGDLHSIPRRTCIGFRISEHAIDDKPRRRHPRLEAGGITIGFAEPWGFHVLRNWRWS